MMLRSILTVQWGFGVTAMLEKRHKLSWDVIRLTHDGLLLQQICIGRIWVMDELPNTKRKFAQDMIPLEAAEVMSDELRSNPYPTHQEISKTLPLPWAAIRDLSCTTLTGPKRN